MSPITRIAVSPIIEVCEIKTLSRQSVFTILIASILAAAALFYFFNKVHDVYRAGYFDLPLYTKAATHYWQDQPVYERSDNLLERYKPGAIVFKFPPTYLLPFLPWFDAAGQWHVWFAPGLSIFYVAFYGVTIGLICWLVLNCFPAKTQRIDRSTSILFVLFSIAFACLYMPFFVVLGGTSGEAYIIGVALIAFLCMQRMPYLSGCMLVYLGCIKLYPFFFLAYPLLTRQWRVLLGAFVGFFLVGGATMWIFGVDEVFFYISKVLPILLSEPVSEDWTDVFRHTTGNQGIVKILVQYGWLPSRLPVWLNTVRLPFVVMMAWLLLRFNAQHNNSQWSSLLGFALVIVTALICLPNVFYSYFIFLIFPLLALAGFFSARQNRKALLLLTLCMACFMVDDVWTYALAEQYGLLTPLPELVEAAQTRGVTLYLWEHFPLFAVLSAMGKATPFMPVILWCFLAFALVNAGVNRYQIPAS